MSQLPVIDDVHVPGIRAWPAGHLAGREHPGRALVRGKRGREGWGGRRALVRGYVDDNKRELTRTLGEERGEGREKESGWPKLPTWQSRSLWLFGRRRNVKTPSPLPPLPPSPPPSELPVTSQNTPEHRTQNPERYMSNASPSSHAR